MLKNSFISTTLNRRSFLAGTASVLAAPPALAQSTDLTFQHAYGEITLPAPAKRVVSLGYNSHDSILALGIAPVGIRYWYGDYPYGVWPWAQEHLGDAKPTVMTGEVSAETVAGLAPDLIVANGSGISEAEYALLSQIAPVLMHSDEYSAYGTPWDVGLRTIARAVGKSDLAETIIADVHGKFADIKARNPDWAGKTAVAAWHDGGQTGAFMGEDTRARFFTDLGFRPTEKLTEQTIIDGFYTTLSPEDLSPLDADLLLWISSTDRAPDIANLAMRRTLNAYREGREVFCNQLLAGAVSFGTVLSLPYALEQLEPQMKLALDGDPSTVVPTALEAGLTE
ncbi:iron complex transport system substrate-binding protein [Yoonia maritima]|uniref:Iron complex transport system substrate-binding protein n=1 Tax=Yoonia maritima TaxID=1435347 RepID=A0A2T0VV73_9RHOB|nr:iron-siderophore ABC transporter substrate-binding protein [Yoonia maritima]PRY75471.1 iron complex transport system substrate-binding protein [Yoonia maritima]